MKYSYNPIKLTFDIDKYKRPNININFSMYSFCCDTYGIFILLEITFFYKLSICLKPIGEINIIKND